jgi:hypothetical protein
LAYSSPTRRLPNLMPSTASAQTAASAL